MATTYDYSALGDDERQRIEDELRRLQEEDAARSAEEAMRVEQPMRPYDRVEQPGLTLGELMAPPADLQPQSYTPGMAQPMPIASRDFRPMDEVRKLQPMPTQKPVAPEEWKAAYQALQQPQTGSATGQYFGSASAMARPSAIGSARAMAARAAASRAMGARRGMR